MSVPAFPKKFNQRRADGLPGFLLEVAVAGHWVHFEADERAVGATAEVDACEGKLKPLGELDALSGDVLRQGDGIDDRLQAIA
jgi:hypothetical protein